MPSDKTADNPSALKHAFGPELLKKLSIAISKHEPGFNSKALLSLSPHLGKLEMKARVHLIRDELKKQLPEKYPKALKILTNVLKEKTLEGFAIWPIAEFIQTYGLQDPEISLEALKLVTRSFTSEWAVRPFILKHPQKTMSFLLECASSTDVDLRRWASEGTRPRVPWGERLQDLIADPCPTRKILEKLKFDPELYVRKSVANHLNDISKDHPAYVIQLLDDWKKSARGGDQNKVDWIIRRSLRSLIKNGSPEALALIGVEHGADVQLEHFEIQRNKIKLGETLTFEMHLRSRSKKPQKLVIDYVVHFRKSNQSTAPKVFKLRTVEIPAQEILKIKRNHAVRKITTREYYAGEQHLEIQVNGKIIGKKSWNLTLK